MVVFLILFLIILFGSGIWIPIETIYYLVNDRFLSLPAFRTAEIIFMFVLPVIFFTDELRRKNDCCGDSAYFSPAHRLSISLLILFCIAFYFFASYSKTATTPIFELLTNLFLIIGLAINVMMIIQSSRIDSPENIGDSKFMMLLQIPIIILEVLALARRHQFDRKQIALQKIPETKPGIFIYKILTSRFFYRFPILLFLCAPLLSLISSLLLLFGQKPDSLIKAFTETYYHGLSQLDCTNVPCPQGHFLCTIAASGHKKFVKPIRKGVRHGYTIKVNRQLLIANAFENLLEEYTPNLHKLIRKTYDYTGGNFKKLYDILGNKWISDIIYVLMKPLEYFFLFILYLFEKKPENRIAIQYIRTVHRKEIESKIK